MCANAVSCCGIRVKEKEKEEKGQKGKRERREEKGRETEIN